MREVGVAEIAVEQVEQGLHSLHAERGIASRRRAEIIVHIRGVRQRHPRGRNENLAEGRRALIAEAGERERRATTRRGTERTKLRLGAVVQCPVQIR